MKRINDDIKKLITDTAWRELEDLDSPLMWLIHVKPIFHDRLMDQYRNSKIRQQHHEWLMSLPESRRTGKCPEARLHPASWHSSAWNPKNFGPGYYIG